MENLIIKELIIGQMVKFIKVNFNLESGKDKVPGRKIEAS